MNLVRPREGETLFLMCRISLHDFCVTKKRREKTLFLTRKSLHDLYVTKKSKVFFPVENNAD